MKNSVLSAGYRVLSRSTLEKPATSALTSTSHFALALALASALTLFNGCQPQKLYKETRVMMGTFVEVVSPDERAPAIAFEEIKRIESLLSKYDEKSEISRLNKTGKVAASKETWYIMQKSKEFWQASGGAFDVTVGPLMNIWGFSNTQYKVPKRKEIEKASKRVGMDKIIFHKNNNVIEFSIPGMAVDLGAIAKGYAVDSAVKKIKAAGVKNCLINTGGDIYCLGNKFGTPWKVAVQNPRSQNFLSTMSMENSAIATSGDYEQYFKNRDEVFSHILDPKTGAPAKGGVISVTVIAEDCLTADALATSLFVLGREKGIELLKKYPPAKAGIVESDNEGQMVAVP
ncbi:MAG: FAD:protein FMN transferase [Candidatus Omnitrophota bacterium]|nr:MAG: FAD:protein FMN transferase [Candidatus Omnitrophota bacterium]